jgi:hypothetical protein
MKQLVRDVASAGCKNSCGLLGSGNNNIIIIIIILLLCGCGGAGDVLGSFGRRRGRRRGSRRGLLWLIILAVILSGNNSGRNANTNIINVDTAAGEEGGLGLLDL